MKRLIFLPLMMLLFGISNAQLTAHHMINVGYEYQKQSFGEVGYRMLFLNKDETLYRVGVSGLFGSTHGKFSAMPKLQGDILFDLEKQRNGFVHYPIYALGGVEVTTKYIAPKAGFSFFGIIDFTGGYAFSWGNAELNGKKLDGFNFNFSLNIPLVALEK